MIRTLILGMLLGLFSGVVPGPFTALIAVTSLRHGFWAGQRIALVPLVSETSVLAVTAVLLSHLPDHALRWTGIIGGVVILFLAIRTFREAADHPDREPQVGSRVTCRFIGSDGSRAIPVYSPSSFPTTRGITPPGAPKWSTRPWASRVVFGFGRVNRSAAAE